MTMIIKIAYPQCLRGNYYQESSSQCQLCPQGCLTCNSSTLCTYCQMGYYLSNTQLCLSCPLYCAICDGLICSTCTLPCAQCNMNGCIRCIDKNYYISSTTKQCIQCNVNCSLCTATACQACISGCYTCNQTQGCVACTENYYYLATTFQCVACPANCKTCTATACSACISNAYLSNAGVCILCDISCATCNNTGCLTCLNGLLNYQTCTPCPTNCRICNSSGICLSCVQGYCLAGNYLPFCIPLPHMCSTCNTCTRTPYVYWATPYYACYGIQLGTTTSCDLCRMTQSCDFQGYNCLANQYSNFLIETCSDCPSYCATCALFYRSATLASISCLTCQSTNLYPPNCLMCPAYCLTCISTITCQSCLGSTYLNVSYNFAVIYSLCYPCPSHCLTCDATTCSSCQYPCATCNRQQCLTCISNRYFPFQMSCYACDDSCLTCNEYGCLTCPSTNYYILTKCYLCQESCLTCDTNGGCLTCPSSDMYIDSNKHCVQCGLNCISCDAKQCLTCLNVRYQLQGLDCKYICTDPCLTCDAQKCYSCIDNKTYLHNDQCNSCTSANCLTCAYINQVQCLSCDPQSYRQLVSNQCVCITGYQDSGGLVCQQIDCAQKSSMAIKSCNYANCQDSVWTYGEECDDSNQIARDGCSNCQIDSGFVCNNIIMKISNCYKCPTNCSQCVYSLNSALCTECANNFYLSGNQCKTCDPKCQGCTLALDNCITCTFQTSQQICSLCEIDDGYYSDYTSKTCYTVCGDGFTSGIEQCDDGNTLSLDGCNSQCQIEQGYYCVKTLCFLIIYPMPNLSIQGVYSLYSDTRQFQIQYNDYIQNIQISQFIKITVDQLSLDNYTYNATFQIQDQSGQFIKPLILIQLLLHASVKQAELNIQFINTKFINKEGFNQQISNLSIGIPDYEKKSMAQINATTTSTSFTIYLLYIILGLAGVSLLIGGIDVFYNLLYLLQTLAYLQYLNTSMPYNLLQYLQLFKQFQLKNIINMLHIWTFQKSKKETQVWAQVPQKMEADGISGELSLNISSFISFPISILGTYLLGKLILTLLKPAIIFQDRSDPQFIVISKIYFLSVKIELIKLSYNLVTQLMNNILQSLQTISTDLSFYLCLGLYTVQVNQSEMVVYLNNILVIALNSLYIFVIFILFQTASKQQYQKNKLKLSTLFQTCKLRRFGKYKNCILLVKKYIFMFNLVLCYDVPLLQIGNICLVQFFYTMYLAQPNILSSQLELNKQLYSEISMTIIYLLLIGLVVDDEFILLQSDHRDIIGWVCFGILSFIICLQLYYDFIQQWPTIKKFIKSMIKKLSDKKPIPRQVQQ